MAKLKSHGKELVRITRERTLNPSPDSLSTVIWERQTRAYMADGKIMEKRDVQWAPDRFHTAGRLHSYGWKLYGRLKEGISPEQHAVNVREKIETGTWKTWKLATGKMRRPVVIPQSRIIKAVQEDNGVGFCRDCGQRQSSYVDPDSTNQVCDNCGSASVYGAQEMLLDTIG